MSGISQRRTCPSLPAHGRHDQPRDIMNHTGPGGDSGADKPPLLRFIAPARHAPSTRKVDARPWRRSMTLPCVCPSARRHLHLERITRPARKKRPVSRYTPRDRPRFPIDIHKRPGGDTPWFAASSRRHHVARVPRVDESSTGSSSGNRLRQGTSRPANTKLSGPPLP